MAMTEASSTNGAQGAPKKKATKARGRRKAGRPDLLGRFGPYLMLRRKQKNLSIRAFAKRAGTPHTNIFQYERLRKDPRLTELAQLAQAFREPLSKFLEPLL
jgi:ribosome-binding protein aMBF1 (putative translation factor)